MSKIKMKQTLSAEGVLRIEEDGQLFLEVEEIGEKSFADLFKMFDGQVIKISSNTAEDIIE